MALGPGRFALEPRRERPDSPPEGYGVPRRGGEFIDWAHVIVPYSLLDKLDDALRIHLDLG